MTLAMLLDLPGGIAPEDWVLPEQANAWKRIPVLHSILVAATACSNRRALGADDKPTCGTHEAASFLSAERLALSLQGGFTFAWEPSLAAGAGRKAKLRVVAETARRVCDKHNHVAHSNVKGKSASLNLPPGPKGLPLFGNVFEPRGAAVRYFTKCVREYGDIVFLRFLGVPMCFVNRPEFIESVLVTQANSFEKSKDYRALRRVLGNGLLTSEGDFWRRQRKLVQPAFHQERIAAYAEVMAGFTRRMVES